MQRTVHTIDATNQTTGKLAVQAAFILMGKHKPEYLPHTDCGDAVQLTNVKYLRISKKKLEQKEYIHHTLYPGGVRIKKAKELTPKQMVRIAINNMLPKNKLRSKMLRRLTIQ